MDLQAHFIASVSQAEARERIDGYLQAMGYSAVPGEELAFKRGSLLGTMTSMFSPRKWKAVVSVSTASLRYGETEVSAKFAVNTTGQWVTPRERAVWGTEVDGLARYVTSGALETENVDQAAKAVKGNTLRIILAFLAVDLVVALAVGIGGVLLTGQTTWGFVGIACGTFLGYAYIHRRYGVSGSL